MTSFIFRCVMGLIAATFVAASSLSAAEPATPGADKKPGVIWVYIGTYTGEKSQGIYVSKLDPATGSLSKPELAGQMANPSYLAISPDHRFIYATGEYGPFKGGSAIGAFSIGAEGKLTALNTQPAGGGGPCYVVVDKTGKNALVANYGTGSAALLPIKADGSLEAPASVDQHPTVGANQPHAHCIDVDSTNRFALCCDLGLDKVYVYKLDAEKGTLAANAPPAAMLPQKTGPRHLVFSPNGKFVYAINETALTVTAFTWDGEHGVLREIQTLSTLPEGFTGKGLSTAEIEIHPSGKFLYGSNRGHDSIVAYSIDESTGKLTLIGHTPTGGKTPRGFGIDPTGQWLIAGNQNSDTLVEFKIDPKTGQLSATGTTFELGAPVCVKFMEGR